MPAEKAAFSAKEHKTILASHQVFKFLECSDLRVWWSTQMLILTRRLRPPPSKSLDATIRAERESRFTQRVLESGTFARTLTAPIAPPAQIATDMENLPYPSRLWAMGSNTITRIRLAEASGEAVLPSVYEGDFRPCFQTCTSVCICFGNGSRS